MSTESAFPTLKTETGSQSLNQSPDQAGTSATRVLIVDDSPEDQLNLQTLLARHSGIQVVGMSATFAEAKTALDSMNPDLVFLDIDLGRQCGFDLIGEVMPFPQIIITTVHQHYGSEAFDVGALDYLVKPISEERLVRALRRLPVNTSTSQSIVPVYRGGGDRHTLTLESMAAILADGDYTRVISGKQEYLDNRRLREWKELLEEIGFVQLDRSTLLKLDEVLSWKPHGLGALLNLRTSGRQLEIGRAAYRRLLELAV